jgi:hypothetical protein
MRPEQHSLHLPPRLDQGADQQPVRAVVATEPGGRRQQAVLEQNCRPILKRMCGRRIRLNPLDVELERAKERRSETKRVDRRADVVDEPRQRQLGGPQAAAELLLRLVNLDLQAGTRKRDRRREPVRPGADNDRPRHDGIQPPGRCSRARPYSVRKRRLEMPKSRFVLAAALVAAVLPNAAHADGQASPGVSQGWNGLADKAHGARFVALPANGGNWTVLARINLRGGTVTRYGSIRGSYGIPGVTLRGDVGGLSSDGRMLVVAEAPNGGSILRSVSRLAVVDARTLRTRARIALPGDFSFDALSPDGRTLYLIQHTSVKDLQRYRVRAYNLVQKRLLPDAIVDRTEPNMRGYPLARTSSRGGAWVYTLYQGDEPFVHALDTVHGRAVCLDLTWHAGQIVLFQSHLALRDNGGRLAVVDRQGRTRATLNLRPSRRTTPTTTWAAAGLSGVGLVATAILLRRRRRQN